jgi:hypothetical protein
VCEPCGVKKDAAVLGLWFGLHKSCQFRCTARAHEMIEARSVFLA